MFAPPFTILPEELEYFDDKRAVIFMRELLWAEAAGVGIGQHLVRVPGNINVADGGIDAVIRDADANESHLIPEGRTGYQIKSGDLSPAKCRQELLERKSSECLKPEVKRLMDAEGTYILVLFKSLNEMQIRRRKEKLAEAFDLCGYGNAKFDLYTADDLASAAKKYPSVITSFNKPELGKALPYSVWKSHRDVSEPRQFVGDKDRKDKIEQIRRKLRNADTECPVIRVTGLPGIGKTRFVFETLFPDDLRHLVIYVKADQFLTSGLFTRLQYDNELKAILVVDECDLRQHDTLVSEFSKQGSRLAVVTMSYDFGKIPSPTEVYELDPMESSVIEEMILLEFPGLPSNIVRRLAEFADGYPRIAFLLAQSYILKPEGPDEYISVGDDALMNRLIGGKAEPESDKFRVTEKVLMGLSLFEKIGFEESEGLDVESRWISSSLGVSWFDFRDVVHEQLQRGLVQGRFYLYVTPFMLRVHLLKKWWDKNGFTRIGFENFVSEIPEEFRYDLLDRFVSTLPYLSSTSRGNEFVTEVLGRDGIFADGNLLRTSLGGKLFLALTEASPGSALIRLRESLGRWSKDELMEIREGRQYVVWSLEKIAIWREHFREAAWVLLRLAEAENASNSNNASGTFVGLFSTAPSPVAPTAAPPEERFPVLEDALSSDSEAVRSLALEACDTALVTRHFSRFAGSEYQGLHRVPKLWEPNTYKDLFDAYQRVWGLLSQSLNRLKGEEKRKASDILLKRSRELTWYGNLAGMVVETLEELATRHEIDNLQILETAMQVIRFDGQTMPETTLQRLTKLRDSLINIDYHSRMLRFVGADLFEDRQGGEGNQVNPKVEEIQQLARESLDSPELLQREMDWLTTTRTADGYRLGYELSMIDEGFTLLDSIIQGQLRTEERFSLFFLGGYFAGMAERDAELWEVHIDALAASADTQPWVCRLTWRSRMPSDRSGLRILQLAKAGIVSPEDLGVFVYGGVIRKLSPEIFHGWTDFLLSAGSEVAVSNALELFYMYYQMDADAPPMPMELAVEIIGHETWFQPSERREQGVRHHWSEIAQTVVKGLPQNALKLAKKMLLSFGISGTIVDGFGFNPVVHGILDEIAEHFPEDVWHLVTQQIGPPIDTPAYYIREWLRGEDRFDGGKDGALNLFPPESIWKWVNEDVENRAWYLASMVPKSLWHGNGRICLARELLVRYGDRDDVLENFSANFSTEGWWGSESLHHLETKKDLLEFRKEETDLNVIRWIDQHIYWLEKDIRRAEVEEERRGF